MTASILAVVPLRLASTRVPKKILSSLGGLPLAVRSVGRVREAFAGDASVRILAAVDASETRDLLLKHFPDLDVVMTDPDLPSGTDRVFVAVLSYCERNAARDSVKGVLNVQGDMPFTGGEGLRQIAAYFRGATAEQLSAVPLATLSHDWPADIKYEDPGAVKVLADRHGHALYFSRFPIPYSRVKRPKLPEADGDMHIGVYGYTMEGLARFCAHAPVPLEKMESLEQLRALWLGMRMAVIRTEARAGESYRGIDMPADLAWAKAFASAPKARQKLNKKSKRKKK
jgi:3-deoxy-manno-octulosonate cytidylyltransferase (CMP-KDO synthetase)